MSNSPSDLLRKRAGKGRNKLWFLLEAKRWMVALVFLLIIFISLLMIGYLYPGAEKAITGSDTIDTMFQASFTATITLVALVLTLNQLVLSQELGVVGDQKKRMEGSLKFREKVSDLINVPVSPSRPSQFLKALVEVSGSIAQDLNKITSNYEDDVTKEINSFTSNLIENSKKVSSSLDGSTFGKFEVVSSALNFNYSSKIYTAKLIRQKYSKSLNKKGKETLDKLIKSLKLFGPAREHFKTLYFQWELINLSRKILFSSIPAIIVSAVMVLFFDPSIYSFYIFNTNTLVLVTSLGVTISILPLFILFSYILRIATITKHTLSIGPFILRETEDVEEVDWNK